MSTIKKSVIAIMVLFFISNVNATNLKSSTDKVKMPKQTRSSSVSSFKTDMLDAKLNGVFENYFLLKDELVKTDGVTAAAKAKLLVTSLSEVKMGELSKDVHKVWMKVMKNVMADAKGIAATQDVKAQRLLFVSLSKKMYDLVKVAKFQTPVYYQFCPMANDGKGANWLSKENAVKNPYYGTKMLKCGEVVETIK
ncbi:DUF3347 domain-containing protein [Flavobacterium sp. P4023]|uniref:DUF3347 domain-containing protein n=1 Tax=Flavobacterium flabelliforme TaxID=2816119 RepID=A0ABS5CQ30_9FLAO|nr:DUF3347 domain-containing protein [Flavobacterium flabelliforme]MBP4140730.1 DUF3347 domain-containing protein [Flavobacterium flabelliforme]